MKDERVPENLASMIRMFERIVLTTRHPLARAARQQWLFQDGDDRMSSTETGSFILAPYRATVAETNPSIAVSRADHSLDEYYYIYIH